MGGWGTLGKLPYTCSIGTHIATHIAKRVWHTACTCSILGFVAFCPSLFGCTCS